MTLTDVEKGYTFTATTNKEGQFILPSIPPSVYTLSAEINGFDKAIRTGIKVDVTAHVTVNMSLKVAGATQTVQVSSQTSTLQTQDATTGQVINRRFIEDLPNTNRYVMDLVQLAPGVTNVDDTCGVNCTGTNFISNGSRNATADVLMDGASITNMEPNGGITNVTYTPSVESVQEFKVQQSNFSAEYGFSGGSIVNMVTQSGTNVFTAACTTLSAVKLSTPTTGSPIILVSRSPISAAITMAAPSADPSSKIRPSSSSIGTVPTRSRSRYLLPAFPAPPSAPATLARCARFTAGPSTRPDFALSLRGRYGIHIPTSSIQP